MPCILPLIQRLEYPEDIQRYIMSLLHNLSRTEQTFPFANNITRDLCK